MVVDFLNIILSLVTSICNLWWLVVPIFVMGIFALVVRIVVWKF